MQKFSKKVKSAKNASNYLGKKLATTDGQKKKLENRKIAVMDVVRFCVFLQKKIYTVRGKKVNKDKKAFYHKM